MSPQISPASSVPTSAPAAHFPAYNPFEVYGPADAARALGIDRDTVTYYLAKRARLFPARDGRNHYWTKAEFERVKLTLLSLCPKAKSNKTTLPKHVH